MTRPPGNPLRIQLSEERKRDLLQALGELYQEAFDEELSPYRAERLLEFFVKALGPTVYNQAIQDARAFVLEKLEDLDAEFYEPDETHPVRKPGS